MARSEGVTHAIQSLLKADDHHDCLRATPCQRALCKGFGAGLVPVGFLGAGRKYNSQLSNLDLSRLVTLDVILVSRWSGVSVSRKRAPCVILALCPLVLLGQLSCGRSKMPDSPLVVGMPIHV